jgi:hypothetical protein
MLPFVSTYTKFSSSTKFSRTCGVCTHTHVGVDLLNLVLEYRSSKFAWRAAVHENQNQNQSY